MTIFLKNINLKPYIVITIFLRNINSMSLWKYFIKHSYKSVVNLAPNALFKQLELYVSNSNVIDASVSTYHYKSITETLLSK